MDLARRHPTAAVQDVVDGFLFWAVWVALSPVVLVTLRRWPLDTKPLTRRVLVHVGASITLAVVHNLIAVAVLSVVVPVWPAASLRVALLASTNPTAFVWGLFTGILFYAAIVMTHAVTRFQRLYIAERVSAAALEAELTQSKLDTLRSQLRPHFLFNTLNAISVFVTEDGAKAQQMLLQLSALLRRSLDEEAHEVSLSQELTFVNHYLDIQRGRFGDRLTVRLAVDTTVLEASVPVFLLQPLLENAIEHGRSNDERTTIALRARREHNMLHITLTDDGRGIGSEFPLREGIGLSNTRARLRHLYGPVATVDVGGAQGEDELPGTRVEIRIPLRESREQREAMA